MESYFHSEAKSKLIQFETCTGWGPPSYKLVYKPHENYIVISTTTINHRIQPPISQLNAIERGPHPVGYLVSSGFLLVGRLMVESLVS